MAVKTSLLYLSLMALTLIAFASSGFATDCNSDVMCNSTAYCNEANPGLGGAARCSLIPYSGAGCNGTSISCATSADCTGKGMGVCYTTKGACLAASGAGGPCLLDGDCAYTGLGCVLGICTENPGYTCSADTDCPDPAVQSCFNGFCRQKAPVGEECSKQADCATGLVCNSANGVCAQCDVTWGYSGSGHIPVDTFCNITNIPTCSLLSLYPTSAASNLLVTPVILPKRMTNDPCVDDSCCATTRCVGGRCVGADTGGGTTFEDNLTYDFCSNSSIKTRNLNTEYIDGSLTVYLLPNLTFFRQYLNNSNLHLMKPYYKATTKPYDSETLWFRGTEDSQPVYGIWFFDPVSHNACFFEQVGTHLTYKCGASGVTDNATALNATHAVVPSEFIVQGSNFIIMSTGNQGKQAAATFIRKITTSASPSATSMGVAESSGAAGYTTSGATFFTKYGVGGAVNSHAIFSDYGAGTTAIQIYKSPAVMANTWIRTNSNFYESWASDRAVATWGTYSTFSHYLISATSASGTWRTYFFSGETPYSTISCCSSDSSCDINYNTTSGVMCCNLNTLSCEPCSQTTNQIYISVRSTDAGFQANRVCPGNSSLFAVRLYSDSAKTQEIHPAGLLTVNVSAGATITPSTCGSSSTPCYFLYKARPTAGTDYLDVRFSRSSQYSAGPYRAILNVVHDCTWVKLTVTDCATEQPIAYAVLDVATNLPGASYTTDTNGYFVFMGLNPDQNLNITIAKDGYASKFASFDKDTDFNGDFTICLNAGTTNQPSNALNVTLPTDVAQVTGGFLKMSYAFFAYPFTWIILIIIFIIGLIVIRQLLIGAIGST